MIKDFSHKGIENFFLTKSKAGIQPAHAKKLARQLHQLAHAKSPKDMDVKGWNLHPLKGEMKDHWSVSVDENWRLTFSFDGNDVTLVNYQDYH